MKCKFCSEQVRWGEYATDKKRRSGVCPECWHKPFNITSVCRADLERFSSEEQIAKLDDGHMEYLASKMADAYCDQVFWIDLEIIAEHILEDL